MEQLAGFDGEDDTKSATVEQDDISEAEEEEDASSVQMPLSSSSD